ncbi:DUF2442 domain-containing protein [Anaerovorax odorimutans]|uniref:DUF2442 domain-containing protein n=1 Tax=Anaerovorax odorimutans TaxID=109327 RepID=UPI0004228AEF|nr:DUF2442 domain-containing protein [Anaerovorax odorimutans]
MPKITGLKPVEEYRIEIGFNNGNTIILDLKDKVQTTRFRELMDTNFFQQIKTDGNRIYWGEMTEISVTEIFELAQREIEDYF